MIRKPITDNLQHRGLPVLPRPVDGEILSTINQILHSFESFGVVHHIVPFRITATRYVESFSHITSCFNNLQKYIFLGIRPSAKTKDTGMNSSGKELPAAWQVFEPHLNRIRTVPGSVVLREFFVSCSIVLRKISNNYRTTIEEVSNNYRRTDLPARSHIRRNPLPYPCHPLAISLLP